MMIEQAIDKLRKFARTLDGISDAWAQDVAKAHGEKGMSKPVPSSLQPLIEVLETATESLDTASSDLLEQL